MPGKRAKLRSTPRTKPAAAAAAPPPAGAPWLPALKSLPSWREAGSALSDAIVDVVVASEAEDEDGDEEEEEEALTPKAPNLRLSNVASRGDWSRASDENCTTKLHCRCQDTWSKRR